MGHVYKSPFPDVELPIVSITDHVLRHADSLADDVAIISADGSSRYTFAELKNHIARLAGGLAAAGFGPGSVLGLMAPNVPEYAIVFHGAARAGGAVTTINPTYGAEEVRYQLRDAGANMLITIPMFLDTAIAAAEGTGVSSIYVIGEGTAQAQPLASLFGDAIEQVPVDFTEHTVVLPYSSGTTGLPKGVMLTHYNLVANINQLDGFLVYDEGEAALAALPFFHIYGMQILMNGLLACGVTVVTMPRFDMAASLEAVQTHKITRFFAVPPIVLGLAKAPVVDNYDLSSMRQVFSGAAPLSAELAAEASARIGCEVVQGYGMTELSPVSHCTPEGQFRAGTSGITVANTESRIVDPDTGEDQPAGERGELWVRGPQVMKGYLNNPKSTSETLDDEGWLHTGDIAIIDEHHHMTVVDRLKELIKYKGFQVPPAELEGLLATHPKIIDVAVIGVDDEEAGELPKAFVVPVPGQNVTLEDVQAFLNDHVASYKQIRILELRASIPKSASGKILRRELRDA